MRPFRIPILLCALGAACACACSGTSDQSVCTGVNDPTVLTLSNVSPALGASVPNVSIVHSFSVLNDIAFEDIALTQLASHTAGDATPAIDFTYTVAAESTDFTSTAVEWSNAPGHVELAAPVVYQTTDGCAYTLPSPLFSYDVNAP